ncbi:MAG: Uma2 family endonuclease [Cyanothece sp. SIO1E1]|nr:Uma2 family endonuclease [Cyanothece sp. SIO1E1]
MIQTPIPQPNPDKALSILTFEEFLSWDDGTAKLFELDDGVPVPIKDPTANHENVIDSLWKWLDNHCLSQELPYVPKRGKQIKLKTEPDQREKSRRADIVIFAEAEWKRLENSPSPAAAYTAPPMVIEVTSSNYSVDYMAKLGEYEALAIQEYWIVDYKAFGPTRYLGSPKQPTIFVFQFDATEKAYREPTQFRDGQQIESDMLGKLELTANQIFQFASR